MTAKIINYYYNISNDDECTAYNELRDKLGRAGYVKFIIHRFLASNHTELQTPCMLDDTPALAPGFVVTSKENKGGFVVEWAEESQYKTHHIKRGYYLTSMYDERLK